MFLDRFGTDDGRARFHPVEYMSAAELPDAEYPYFLTTGRVLVHYQSGTQTRRIKELVKAEPEAFAEIHPDTAGSLGISPGDKIRLTTRRGRAVMKARLTRDIRLDTVFAPFHWGGGACANSLTNPALDPVSRIPEFKVCAVRVEKVAAPAAARTQTPASTFSQ
jgi:assimilatory nitrate reductase catalytic subunit